MQHSRYSEKSGHIRCIHKGVVGREDALNAPWDVHILREVIEDAPPCGDTGCPVKIKIESSWTPEDSHRKVWSKNKTIDATT